MGLGTCFEKYYSKALELADKDPRQATEKLWGAIAALIKLHASLKGDFIARWDHDRLYGSSKNWWGASQIPLRRGLDRGTFNIFRTEALELLDQAK
jgi:hypothetical protein